tara:strand:- start:970 stop:3117 length:2148 start_codon:yes stop_codon:yes gene_type:complete
MNIIDIQDQLKNFSEQQLISEMQMPSGSAPQFLVLSEIKRRKRVRDDFTKREAAQQPTVAQEAVASAGVPQSGIAGMAEAMAPKSTMVQKDMRSGGLMQFGSEIQRGLAEKAQNEQIEPFLDEVEQMAQTEFGVDSASFGAGMRPMPTNIRPMTPSAGLAALNPFGATKTGGKGGAMLGMNRMATLRAQSNPVTEPQVMPSPVQKYDEGGVVRASIGAFFNPDGTPTEAGIRALIAQESGGDPKARGSLDEVGIGQIRPSTALMPGYGVQSMFPEIAAKIGEGKEYATADDAYLANKDLIDAGLEDVDMSTRFSKDYLTAMSKQFPSDPNRALAAYNVGPGTAAELENPAEFDYVTSVLGRMGDGSDEPGIISKVASAINPISTAQAQGVGSSLTSPTMMFDDDVEDVDPTRELRGGRKRRRDGETVLTEDDRGEMSVADSFQVIQDAMDSGELPEPAGGEGVLAGRNVPREAPPEKVVLEEEDLADPVIMQFSELSPGQQRQYSKNRSVPGVDLVIDDREMSPIADFVMGATGASDDEDTVEDPAAPPTTPEPEAQPERKGTDDGSTPQTGLAKEIADLRAKLEKDRETDKYLALAQAGLALMSSKEPTLLGAAGEAGISGLTAFREAQDRYQEGVVDLINAKAKLQKKSGSGSEFTANQMLQRASDLRKQIADGMGSEEDNIRNAFLADMLEQRAFGMVGAGGLGAFDVATQE